MAARVRRALLSTPDTGSPVRSAGGWALTGNFPGFNFE